MAGNPGRINAKERFALCCALLAWFAPAHAQEPSWRFVVFGDCIAVDGSEVNTNIAHELASAAAGEHPDFLLFAGDCSYSGSAAGLELWTNSLSPLYEAGARVFPAPGNHDAADFEAYTNIISFAAPPNGPPGEEKTTYAVAWRNALLIVLNEYALTNSLRVNQAWLDSVVATNVLPHVFAVGHTPAFGTVHPDCLAMYPTNRDRFWNSLSNAHARIYFCGHDHTYDHSQVDDSDGDPQNDLHQFIVGTGGGPLYIEAPYLGASTLYTPRRIWHEGQYGYLSVEVAGENVTTTWHPRTGANNYPAGEVFSYSLRSLPFLRHTYADGKLTLSWTGSALLQESSAPGGPFHNLLGATSPFVINTFEDRLFFRLMEPPNQSTR